MILIIIAAIVCIIVFATIGKKKNSESVEVVDDNAPEWKKQHPKWLYDAEHLTEAQEEAIRQAEEYWESAPRFQIHSGIYTGPLPEKREDGTWTSIYPEYIKMTIAGTNHRGSLKRYVGPVSCVLEAEPKNKFDKNAIKVVHRDGKHLGYIPADMTAKVREFIGDDLPGVHRGAIRQRIDDYDGHDYYFGEIIIEKPSI